MAEVLFRPGDVMATADALRALEFNEVTPQGLLGRHMRGDWGELPAWARRENELQTLRARGTVTSRYRLDDGEIILITTDLHRADTLISQPGDDKFLSKFAQAWRPPCFSAEPPGFPYYLVRIWTGEPLAQLQRSAEPRG